MTRPAPRSAASASTILPFPSSPHPQPTTAVTLMTCASVPATRRRFLVSCFSFRVGAVGSPKPETRNTKRLHLLEEALRGVGGLGLDAAQGVETVLGLQVAAAGGGGTAVDARHDPRGARVPRPVGVGEQPAGVAETALQDGERF